MARGINKVILVGNLGNDPETRYTQGGMAITRISLATTSVRKDKDGNQQERTEWHRVVFFGKLGEIAGEYLRKGSSVYVEGRLKTRKWQKDGVDQYTTEIIADQMQLLGGREVGAAGGSGGGSRGGSRSAGGDFGDDAESGHTPAPAPRAPRAPMRQAAPAPRPAPRPAPAPAPKSSTGFDDMDDDIPF